MKNKPFSGSTFLTILLTRVFSGPYLGYYLSFILKGVVRLSSIVFGAFFSSIFTVFISFLARRLTFPVEFVGVTAFEGLLFNEKPF